MKIQNDNDKMQLPSNKTNCTEINPLSKTKTEVVVLFSCQIKLKYNKRT